MAQYTLELNSAEKALIQNALINLKYSLGGDMKTPDTIDALLYRVQIMRCHSYDER